MSRRGRQSSTGRGKYKMATENGWETQGGYMAAKMQKLEDQYKKDIESGEENKSIFKGVAIYVNGYTKPSSDELKRLVVCHGGRYEHYLYRTKVTHIIATNLPHSKIKDLMKNGKVVKPEWITDSVKAGRLLPYVQYLLYTAQGGKQQGMESFSSYSVTHHSSTEASDTMETQSHREFSATILRQSEPFHNSKSEFGSEEKNNFRQHLYNDSETAGSMKQTDCDDSEMAVNLREDENTGEIKTNSVLETDKIAQISQRYDRGPDHFGGNNHVQRENITTVTSPEKMNHSTDQSHSIVTNTKSTGMAKAGDPAFLNEFYSNSRLHHLSTWKSEWRAYVKTLQSQGHDFPGRTKLMQIVNQKDKAVTSRLGNSNMSRSKSGKPQRVIMHIDMDCFFVSVGLRRRPELRGKPVAVTHSRGQGMKNPIPGSDPDFERQQWELRRNQRSGKKGKNIQQETKQIDDEDSEDDNETNEQLDKQQTEVSDSFHSMAEIASCSYEARQAGVRNGMFMGRAKQLCPELLTIPYDFDGYQEVSKVLYDTVASYTHDIEAVSCDEMLVDCTDLLSSTGADPLDFSSVLRQELKDKTGCPASAGIGSSILLAKMATRKAKPNGQFYLTSENVLNFISGQSIQNIPGVGWSMSKKLKSMNIETCGDLQKVSLGVLQKEFGPKTGQSLYKYCRGEDDRPIKMEQERKSVSAEINYGIRFKHNGEAEKFLEELSEEVHSRLKNIDRKGKTITLKVMVRREDAPMETSKFMGHGICNNISKSVTLPLATDDAKIISKECLGLLNNMKVKASDLRGVGIQVQRLEPATLGNQQKFTKGAQSILNFTVSKQASPGKSVSVSPNASEVTSPPVSNVSLENNLDLQTTLKQDKSMSTSVDEVGQTLDQKLEYEGNTFLGGYCHNIVDELSRRKTAKRFLPPLPSLPDISASPEISTATEGSHDYFPSPSQIDHSVLSELPPDIRKQVENEMSLRRGQATHKQNQAAYQNSPCSSKSSGAALYIPEEQPGCSHWSTPPQLTNLSCCTKSSLESFETLPSPSQIDPGVLRELPAEIQQQVEKEVALRQKKGMNSANQHRSCVSGEKHLDDQNSSSSYREINEDQAGCSRWSYKDTTDKEVVFKSLDEAIVPLPSPSQLDESCLSALPAELQKEIREAYIRQEKEVNSQPHSMVQPLNLQQASSPSKRSPDKPRSPAKTRSPKGSRKLSPNFKVPRGKPRRGRPKKLEFRGQRQPKITAAVDNKQHDKRQNCLPLPDFAVTTLSHEDEIQSIPGQRETTDENKGLLSPKDLINENTVNLCGAVTISEVRTLLREWLKSSPAPEQEDEEVMVGYLQDLVLDQNLEQVDLVLKFLRRHTQILKNQMWIATFDRILHRIQAVVQSIYGSQLKT